MYYHREGDCPPSPIAPILGVLFLYYGIVRYLYMRSLQYYDMSQMMAIKSKNAIIQDIVFSKKFTMHSSANLAKCDVCGKGLGDGFSITAKSILNETKFFCESHLNY
jgi:hypothetical protein